MNCIVANSLRISKGDLRALKYYWFLMNSSPL